MEKPFEDFLPPGYDHAFDDAAPAIALAAAHSSATGDVIVFGARYRLKTGARVSLPVLFLTDRDNGDHYLTPAQVIDLVNAGKVFMQALHEAKRALKASDPIPVNYNHDSYWP